VRLIEVDDELRLDIRALERQISLDSNQGLRPMMIAATAGTTDTGSIDPLDECAELAARTGAWFHVDAAYGGFFQLTERGRSRLGGIGRADSITVDAHKSLFMPFGVGGLLMRDRAAVVDAHEGFGAYMQDVVDGELPHYMEMGPEQTRPNRGVQVWLAANLHGVGRFRTELDRMLDLAEQAAGVLSALDGIELSGTPHLSIVAFRSSAGDEATRAIFDTLIASRKVHVSTTTIDDYVYIRLAFLNQRTTQAVLDTVVDIVQSAAGASNGGGACSEPTGNP
jgi:aromatic-L-amino-acid decarboxylase